MKARAVRLFSDIEAGCDRKPGDVFECSEERFAALNSTRYGVLVEKAAAPKKARKARNEE